MKDINFFLKMKKKNSNMIEKKYLKKVEKRIIKWAKTLYYNALLQKDFNLENFASS